MQAGVVEATIIMVRRASRCTEDIFKETQFTNFLRRHFTIQRGRSPRLAPSCAWLSWS